MMRVSTRWRDASEFVAAFSRWCSETECFVPTHATRKPGEETAFSIRLVDGTPMLRGVCTIRACWTKADSPFGRAGVSLAIVKLSPHSADIMRRILDARDTVEMEPLKSDEMCELDNFDDTVPTRAPIMTTLGVAPAPSAAPRAIVAEPVARKLPAPRPSWWERTVQHVRRLFVRPLTRRPRLARVALPALSREGD